MLYFLISNDVVTFTLDLLRCVDILKLDGHASVHGFDRQLGGLVAT